MKKTMCAVALLLVMIILTMSAFADGMHDRGNMVHGQGEPGMNMDGGRMQGNNGMESKNLMNGQKQMRGNDFQQNGQNNAQPQMPANSFQQNGQNNGQPQIPTNGFQQNAQNNGSAQVPENPPYNPDGHAMPIPPMRPEDMNSNTEGTTDENETENDNAEMPAFPNSPFNNQMPRENQIPANPDNNRPGMMPGMNFNGEMPENKDGINIEEVQKAINEMEDGEDKTTIQTLLDRYRKALEEARIKDLPPLPQDMEAESDSSETDSEEGETSGNSALEEASAALKEALNALLDMDDDA